jgi:hypothetical protein
VLRCRSSEDENNSRKFTVAAAGIDGSGKALSVTRQNLEREKRINFDNLPARDPFATIETSALGNLGLAHAALGETRRFLSVLEYILAPILNFDVTEAHGRELRLTALAG